MFFHEFTKNELSENFEKAQTVAKSLYAFMQSEHIARKIYATHQFQATSTEIQNIILPKCMELGFESEKKGLFSDYKVARLRPDYFLRLNDSGIILEVERGKTTVNNMDLLDMWKCHICAHAEYLILVVPIIRQSGNGATTKVFDRVLDRLAPFFQPTGYVNVEACFVIGY